MREIALMPSNKEEHASDWNANSEIEVENVDQIVMNQLQAIESPTISNLNPNRDIQQSSTRNIQKHCTVKNFMSVGNVTQAVTFDARWT